MCVNRFEGSGDFMNENRQAFTSVSAIWSIEEIYALISLGNGVCHMVDFTILVPSQLWQVPATHLKIEYP